MDKYDDQEIELGLSLAVAIDELRMHTDQWERYQELKTEISDFEQRDIDRAEWRSPTASQPIRSLAEMYDFSGIPREIQHEIEPQRVELEDLEKCFRAIVHKLLSMGRWEAFGKVGGLSEPYKLIRPEYWKSMQIVDFERSIVRENTQAKTEWLEVRVFSIDEEPRPTISVMPTKIDAYNEEPPPIPPFPKFSGELALNTIKKMVRRHPDRFEWGYSGAITAGAFAIEVAAPTRYSVEACRKLIREQKPEIMKIINSTKSNN